MTSTVFWKTIGVDAAILVRLAFRARAKLGLRGIADIARAVGCSRQFVYRTLSKDEIAELGR